MVSLTMQTLEEEGAAIVAFKLVDCGVFQEQGITELLKAPGLIPGNFGMVSYKCALVFSLYHCLRCS